jgi:hypothetical protein
MEQKAFSFQAGLEPEFEIGQSVWFLIDSHESDQYFLSKNPNWTRHRQSKVSNLRCELFQHKGELFLSCRGYKLSTMRMKRIDYFYGRELYS